MHIHHLNCGSMCPMGARLVHGKGGFFERARLVCHVLLAETRDGLALVDTGLGLGDIADPMRLGRKWVRQTAPRLDRAETAFEQVRALGYSPDDVRHVLVTHLDLDHAGGLADFPKATVHVHALEHGAAVTGSVRAREGRYIGKQWGHGPNWKLHAGGGEDWFGFQGVRALDEREPDVLMIPLHGHTPGHCGIAVKGDDGRWRLHAGDAYFHHGQIRTPQAPTPLGLRIFQKKADTDRALRMANQERLRVLKAE